MDERQPPPSPLVAAILVIRLEFLAPIVFFPFGLEKVCQIFEAAVAKVAVGLRQRALVVSCQIILVWHGVSRGGGSKAVQHVFSRCFHSV